MAVLNVAKGRARVPAGRDLVLILVVGFLVLQQGLPRVRAFAQGAEDVTPTASALSGAFTYQGKLVQNGTNVTGQRDFQFALFDAASDGAALATVDVANQTVAAGLFTVQLDFGALLFTGEERWLEVRVKPAGSGTYEVVGRQQLTATPYAFYAKGTDWAGVANKPAGFADGIDNDLLATLAGCTTGQVPKYTGTTFACGSVVDFGSILSGSKQIGLKLTNTASDATAIWSEATGVNGTGVHAEGTYAGILASSPNLGALGVSSGAAGSSTAGVYGQNTGAGRGVEGRSIDGISVKGSTGSTNASVAAIEGDATGNAIGVRASSEQGLAVYATSTTSVGVYATGDIGVAGYGVLPGGVGVEGISNYTNGIGVSAFSGGVNGIGLKASADLWAGYFDGDVRVTGLYNPSDIRLKQDIAPLAYGLEQVEALKPMRYEYKVGDGTTHLGLIAQDVQAVLPELVKADPTQDGMLGLNYTEIIPVLVNAIQQQQAEIEGLRGAAPAAASTSARGDGELLTWLAIGFGGLAFAASLGTGALVLRRR